MGAFQNKQEYYFENGGIKAVLPYVEGVLDGFCKQYFESGSLQRTIEIQNGKKNGEEVIYSEDEKILDFGSYLEDIPIGIHKKFDNGYLIEEIDYSSKTPYYKQFDEKGVLIFESFNQNEQKVIRKLIDGKWTETIQ